MCLCVRARVCCTCTSYALRTMSTRHHYTLYTNNIGVNQRICICLGLQDAVAPEENMFTVWCRRLQCPDDIVFAASW